MVGGLGGRARDRARAQNAGEPGRAPVCMEPMITRLRSVVKPRLSGSKSLGYFFIARVVSNAPSYSTTNTGLSLTERVLKRKLHLPEPILKGAAMFRSVLMRAARTALRAEEAAATDPAFATKLKFNFSIPATPIYSAAPVRMVIVPGASGVFGVLKDHVPTTAAMKPGVVQVQENEGDAELKQYFVSGGFAFVKPDSTLDIQAVEAVKLEDLDVEAVKKGVASYAALVASSTDEKEKAQAEVNLEVYQAMAAALGAA